MLRRRRVHGPEYLYSTGAGARAEAQQAAMLIGVSAPQVAGVSGGVTSERRAATWAMPTGTEVQILTAAADRRPAPLGDSHQLIRGPGMLFGVHRAHHLSEFVDLR